MGIEETQDWTNFKNFSPQVVSLANRLSGRAHSRDPFRIFRQETSNVYNSTHLHKGNLRTPAKISSSSLFPTQCPFQPFDPFHKLPKLLIHLFGVHECVYCSSRLPPHRWLEKGLDEEGHPSTEQRPTGLRAIRRSLERKESRLRKSIGKVRDYDNGLGKSRAELSIVRGWEGEGGALSELVERSWIRA